MNEAGWVPSEDLLDELAMVLTLDDDFGQTSWFDRVDHTLHMLTFDPEDGIPSVEVAMPEEIAVAERILADQARYLAVPAEGSATRLRDFLDSVADEALAEALRDAADGGRGAYRRVRGELERRGLEQLWYDFETAAQRRFARSWLQEHGLVD